METKELDQGDDNHHVVRAGAGLWQQLLDFDIERDYNCVNKTESTSLRMRSPYCVSKSLASVWPCSWVHSGNKHLECNDCIVVDAFCWCI